MELSPPVLFPVTQFTTDLIKHGTWEYDCVPDKVFKTGLKHYTL